MGGWDEEERLKYKAVIYRNIIDSLSDTLTACARFGYELEEKNKAYLFICLFVVGWCMLAWGCFCA